MDSKIKKIGYLGSGSWGFCLAVLLAGKGYEVVSWTTKPDLAEHLNKTGQHPFLPQVSIPSTIRFTTDLEEALDGIDLLAESVTSAGLRPVFEKVKTVSFPKCPIVITSKGIEQNTGLILPDVAVAVLGEGRRSDVGILSGPSFAEEVIRGLPTSVVASAYSPEAMHAISETFTTDKFRVYPNSDMDGVAFGGALKNIIAIACGIAEGLGLGYSTKAALITRGLHEIRKLAIASGCKADTINGLSGLGDIVLTCSSMISRNYRFGFMLTQGMDKQKIQEKIEMVVEGVYSCVSALQLSKQLDVSMPITETIHAIIYEGMAPMDGVKNLMQRTIKEEHL